MTIAPAFLTTPNTCGVMGLLQSGSAFSTSLLGSLGSLQTSISSAAQSLLSLPNLIEGIVLSDVQALANNLIAIASGAISSMLSHVTAQLTGLINNLSLAVGQAAAQAGLTSSGCGLPSLGPSLGSGGGTSSCANIQNLFGSIMGLGETLVNSVLGALNNVTSTISGLIGGAIGSGLSAINSALGTITGAISEISGFATQMTNMIASETAALGAMLTDMLSFSAANALFSLFNNPCAAQVLNAVGTPALLGHLGG